ncbi:MAG TPA: 2-phospho-L-lactate transferase CofD family protein, partial [Aminivibrio sp.]|nr:2-phospho-L-lactate transferase CofD family protein [Aminivibrio sp.]
GKRITKVKLVPERPRALPMAIEAIEDAEMIIIGPGSLYTSIMPNLITEGVAQAVADSDAFRVHVLNIMTQDGETEHYTAADHIAALFGNSGERLFDWCLANSAVIPEKLLARYADEGAEPVYIDEAAVSAMNVKLRKVPVATWKNGLVRHDPDALAEELISLYRENSHTRIYL